MKFAKYLQAESIPEWKSKYINYKYLKKLLKQVAARKEKENEEQRKQQPFAPLPPPALLDQHPSQSMELKVQSSLPTSTTSLEAQKVAGEASGKSSVDSSPEPSKIRRKSRLEQRPSTGSISGKLGKSLRWLTPPTLKLAPSAAAVPFEQSIIAEETDPEMALHKILHYKSFEEQEFFSALDAELEKINRFYKAKEEEAAMRMVKLRPQIHILQEALKHRKQKSSDAKSEQDSDDERDDNQQDTSDGLQKTIHATVDKSVAHMRDFIRKVAEKAKENDIKYTIPNNPRGSNALSEFKSIKIARSRLKQATAEHYRGLELLKNYKILNYTGFVKILKKFDKTACWRSSALYIKKVESSLFQQSKTIEDLLMQSEDLFAETFTKGSRRDAMHKLRIPDFKKQTHHSSTWKAGLYLGLSLPALLSTAISLFDPEHREKIPSYAVLIQIFAGFSIPILFVMLFSINLYVWSFSNINYRFIFEFDPRDNLNHHEFAEMGATLFLVWSYSVYFTFNDTFGIFGLSPIWWPLIFVGVVIFMVTMPLPIFYPSARSWFLVTLWRIVTAPYYHVEFRDFFVTDELNSMVYSFGAVQLFFCSYRFNFTKLDEKCNISDSWISPVITMLPAWWRLMQCVRRYADTRLYFPHAVNGGKYLCSIIVIWMSATQNISQNDVARGFWIFFSVVATIYAYSWDIIMDWGFLRKSKNNPLLRDDLIYSWKWSYYWAMVSNFFLRIGWVFIASIGTWQTAIDRRGLLYILALAEVLRRFQWNFFRMENEHSNNCGQFRAVKEIPLPFEIIGSADVMTGAKGQPLSPDEDDLEIGDDKYDINRSDVLSSLKGKPSVESASALSSSRPLATKLERAEAILSAIDDHDVRAYAGREYDRRDLQKKRDSISMRPVSYFSPKIKEERVSSVAGTGPGTTVTTRPDNSPPKLPASWFNAESSRTDTSIKPMTVMPDRHSLNIATQEEPEHDDISAHGSEEELVSRHASPLSPRTPRDPSKTSDYQPS